MTLAQPHSAVHSYVYTPCSSHMHVVSVLNFCILSAFVAQHAFACHRQIVNLHMNPCIRFPVSCLGTAYSLGSAHKQHVALLAYIDSDGFVSAQSHGLVIAGDSRAVLSRGDVAIPLTDDHKAAREDETVSLLLHMQQQATNCDGQQDQSLSPTLFVRLVLQSSTAVTAIQYCHPTSRFCSTTHSSTTHSFL